MLELIPMLLGVISVLLIAYAIVTRRRWLESKALLADTMIRFESVLQHNKQAEQQVKAAKEQTEKLKVQFQKAEKQLEDNKQKLNERGLEAVRAKNEADEIVKKAERQREHLLEQVQVLTQQLSESVKDKKQALDELHKAERELEHRAQLASESSRQQLNELQGQLQQAKRERQNIQTQFDKLKQESGLVKPEELKRWQLKVARLEQLYASMKGLREMAEERNRNWETALRVFAAHILERPAIDVGIGLLVGEALEKIGATLVYEDEPNASDASEQEAGSQAGPHTPTPKSSSHDANALS